MAKKRKTTRKRKSRPKKKKKSLLKLWMIQLIAILGCVFVSYCVWLDFNPDHADDRISARCTSDLPQC